MLDNFRYHFKRGLPFIITILLLLLFPAYIFLRKNGFLFFENKSTIKELLWARQDSILIDSLKKNEVDSGVMQNKRQDSKIKSEIIVNTLPSGDPGANYYVIVGSFSNPKNAKPTSENYQRRGFETSIISVKDRIGTKITLVSVKAFSNLKEAEEYLKKFKEKSDPAAWIYTKK